MDSRKNKALRAFGRRLAILRKQKDLSVRQLAAASGLDYRQIQRIEAGKVNFRLTTLFALAKGLEITLVQLLGPPDPPESAESPGNT